MVHKKYAYSTVTDDLVETANQHYQIDDSHVWYHRGRLFRFLYLCAYTIFYLVFGAYARVWLGVRFKGKEILKPWAGKSFFIYGNHTLPLGDVALTIMLNYPHPVSAMMSQANFGIPLIGRILEWANMLPVPHTPEQHQAFHMEMDNLVKEGTAIAIYPEAHVWPYYTGIRPYSAKSFAYPARYGLPSFCSTVTYQKRLLFKRPRVTVYIDGPFFPDGKEGQEERLRTTIYDTMVARSTVSTYRYASYRRQDRADQANQAGQAENSGSDSKERA